MAQTTKRDVDTFSKSPIYQLILELFEEQIEHYKNRWLQEDEEDEGLRFKAKECNAWKSALLLKLYDKTKGE